MHSGKFSSFLCYFSALFCGLIFLTSETYAQPLVRHVLFLGNSYTYVNDLPLLTAALAHSAGDSLVYDSHAPGGYTFGWQPIAHATDPVSLAKINGNNWDFVILQEQSQTPAIHRLRDSCMFPGAAILHDSIKAANPCARPLFFLTWGRKFGGTQCFVPNYCSAPFTGFSQMQDTLTVAYKTIADSLGDWIAPVGEAWRYVISTTGMVLHSSDESHPNLNGSYLAACVFYSVIFAKSPVGLPFMAGLLPDSALVLQQAADSITFGYASAWNLNNDLPKAVFETTISADTLHTRNLSSGAGQWLWNFGDGSTSTEFEPLHVYNSAGKYAVRMKACNDCFCDSSSREVTVIQTSREEIENGAGKISICGPDEDGRFTFRNYHGSGVFSVYDLQGRWIRSVPVVDGMACPKLLDAGLYVGRLEPPQLLTPTHTFLVKLNTSRP